VLGLYGASYILLPLVPCEPDCVPDVPSLRLEAHYLLGRIIAVTAVAAPVALYARLSRDDRWARWRVLVLGLPVVGWVAWLSLSFTLPSVPIGLRQRLWLALTLAGIELLALRLARLTGTR
jgi:hypothetical protein